VGPTVDDVEARSGENVRSLDAGKVSKVLVEGDALYRFKSDENKDEHMCSE
jgi:hypothetical protein